MEENDFIVCPKCNAKNPSNYVFCMNCGERQDGKFKCTACGTLLNKDAVFCTECGKRYDGNIVCPSCHIILEENANFCWKCGHSFKMTQNSKKLKTSSTIKLQSESLNNDNKCFIASKLFLYIKQSLILALTLVMFILCFLPIYRISINDYVVGEELAISGIDYIALMFDQTKKYDTYEDFLDSSLGKRFSDIKEEIENIEDEEKGMELIKKNRNVIIRSYVMIMRVQSETVNNSQIITLTLFGLLSFLYILLTFGVFVLATLKFIFLFTRKEEKFKKWNIIYGLPLLAIIPLMLFGKSDSLSIHNIIISYTVLLSVLLAGEAAVFLLKNKVKNVAGLVLKTVSIALIAITLGFMNISMYKLEVTGQPSDRESSRVFEYEYQGFDLKDSYKYSNDELVQSINDSYSNIGGYNTSLQNTIGSRTNNNIINNNEFLSDVPYFVIIKNGYSSINELFGTEFVVYFFEVLIGAALLLSLYHSIFKKEKHFSASNVFAFLSLILSFISLLFVILFVILLNYYLDTVNDIVFKISAGSIMVFIMSIINIIMINIQNKKNRTEKSAVKHS